MFQLTAESARASQAVRDPARYTPVVLKNIERYNQAVEHFRATGHRWPTSEIHTIMLTGLSEIKSPEAFQNWLLITQKQRENNGDLRQFT